MFIELEKMDHKVLKRNINKIKKKQIEKQISLSKPEKSFLENTQHIF